MDHDSLADILLLRTNLHEYEIKMLQSDSSQVRKNPVFLLKRKKEGIVPHNATDFSLHDNVTLPPLMLPSMLSYHTDHDGSVYMFMCFFYSTLSASALIQI